MVVASLGLGAAACSSSSTPPSASGAAQPAAPSPVQDADKHWTMQNKTASATRYSSVNEINTENVKNLKVAWSFSTGVLRGHEGEPLRSADPVRLAVEHRARGEQRNRDCECPDCTGSEVHQASQFVAMNLSSSSGARTSETDSLVPSGLNVAWSSVV